MQTIFDVYENLEDFDLTRKRKVLVVFDDMRADMESNRKLKSIVAVLFMRRKKKQLSNIFYVAVFLTVPKTTRTNTTYYLIIEIPYKMEQLALSCSFDFNFKDFVK